jgi:hypothetical protein
MLLCVSFIGGLNSVVMMWTLRLLAWLMLATVFLTTPSHPICIHPEALISFSSRPKCPFTKVDGRPKSEPEREVSADTQLSMGEKTPRPGW